MKKQFALSASLPKLIALIVVVSGFGAVGAREINFSSAAGTYNHNAVGTVDFCTLSGTTTVIEGWAHDPDAPAGPLPSVNVNVGGSSKTVATNIANFRDPQVNAYLRQTNPNAPTSSIYGWSVSFGTLYKGGSYVVSGTALNTGSGSNTALLITTTPTSGSPNGTVFNSNYTIPDSCLATKPAAAPAPAPTPTPAPKPAPAPTPAPAPVSSAPKPVTPAPVKKSTTPIKAAPAAPAVPAPTGNADATVATGTTSAVLTIPTGNAAKLHITYTGDNGTAVSTDDQAVSGASTLVTLKDLAPAAHYSYTITRTNGAGAVAVSPAANFTTAGYTVTLVLDDAKGKPVSGIEGAINDSSTTTATSDDSGNLTFTGLSSGSYTVTYSYKGKRLTRDFDTTTDTSDQLNSDGTPAVITLTDTINVDNNTLTKKFVPNPTKAKKGSAAGVIFLIIFLLLLVGGGIWFFLRRRRNTQQEIAYSSTLAEPAPTAQPLPPTAPYVPETTAAPSAGSQPSHAGESLRDMVIESMREQAIQHPNAVAPPIVPGAHAPQAMAPAVAPHIPAVAAPLPTPQQAAAPPVQPAVAAPAHHPTGPPAKPKQDSQELHISHDK